MASVCAEPGCPNLNPCATHKRTPWAGSTRGATLPSDWPHRKRQRHQQDDWRCVDCGLHDPTGRLLECDHIGDPNDHRIEMLRTRCADIAKGGNGCHRKQTSAQAAKARARR